MESCPRIYRPRRPQQTPLYRLLESLYEPVKLAWEERFETRYGFWQGCWDSAVARYLDCGVWEHGFARVRCGECRYEMLVAFSCKQRELCPSCAAKRGSELAAFLVDQVLERELHGAAEVVASILDFGSTTQGPLVRALEDALDGGRDRVLSLLALRHPPELVQRARVNLRSRTPGKRAQAVELIDAVVGQDVAGWVVPLIEDLPHADRLERFPDSERPRRSDRLDRLRALASGEQDLGAWCRACALDLVAAEGLGGLAGEVR